MLAFGLVVETYSGIANGAFFLYDLTPAKTGGWFIGHTWSLAVEEQFYLTFPAILKFTPRTSRRRVFLTIFCLLGIWNYFAAIFAWNDFTNPAARAGFACISFGVLVALYESEARTLARRLPALFLAVILLTLLWHPADYFSWSSALYDSIYMPTAIAALLVFSLECDSLLRTLLRLKPVQAVGLTSYAIYLWQELFTAPISSYINSGKVIALLLPILMFIVPSSWFFIEMPAMKLGKSLAGRVRTQTGREALT